MQSSSLIASSKPASPAGGGGENQNSTTTTTTTVDCAKECPCGVPVIKVPAQWLEVVVTGGFKVWHIIFIIIALLVILTVIYCCFHRCRIPRTKQEIEADLMRSTLADKFSAYLCQLSSEPASFLEALKRVQELEEKWEQDDALARETAGRKRLGWLKLKGNKATDKDKDKEKEKDKDKDKDKEKTAEQKEAPEANGSGGGGGGATRVEMEPPAQRAEARPSVSSVAFAASALVAAAAAAGAPAKEQLAASVGGKAAAKTMVKPEADEKGASEQAELGAAAATAATAATTKSNGNLQVAPSKAAGPQQQRKTRRHKPNLARTKATRDRSQSGQLEPLVHSGAAKEAGANNAPSETVAPQAQAQAQPPLTTVTTTAKAAAETNKQTSAELTVPSGASSSPRRHRKLHRLDRRRHHQQQPNGGRTAGKQAASKASGNANANALAPP